MGLIRNIARMVGILLAVLHTRMELLAVELQEDVQRLFFYALLFLVALFCATVTFLLAIFLVIVLFWDTYRIGAICGLTVFFGGVTVLIGLGIRSSYRKKPGMLAYTRSEIAKDIERLKSGE